MAAGSALHHGEGGELPTSSAIPRTAATDRVGRVRLPGCVANSSTTSNQTQGRSPEAPAPRARSPRSRALSLTRSRVSTLSPSNTRHLFVEISRRSSTTQDSEPARARCVRSRRAGHGSSRSAREFGPDSSALGTTAVPARAPHRSSRGSASRDRGRRAHRALVASGLREVETGARRLNSALDLHRCCASAPTASAFATLAMVAIGCTICRAPARHVYGRHRHSRVRHRGGAGIKRFSRRNSSARRAADPLLQRDEVSSRVGWPSRLARPMTRRSHRSPCAGARFVASTLSDSRACRPHAYGVL